MCWRGVGGGYGFARFPPSVLIYRYIVAREICKVLQISGMVLVLSAYNFLAIATLDEEALSFGLPPLLPLALAASMPAMVRSVMRFRSNSARAPKI
jgi:hypothetical protein